MWQSIYWSSYDLDFAIFVDSILRLISMAVLSLVLSSLLLPLPLFVNSSHTRLDTKFGFPIFSSRSSFENNFVLWFSNRKGWFTCKTLESEKKIYLYYDRYSIKNFCSTIHTLYFSPFYKINLKLKRKLWFRL